MAKQIRQGWKLGSEDFLERLEEKVKLAPKKGSHHPEEVTTTMVAKANRLIAWGADHQNNLRQKDTPLLWSYSEQEWTGRGQAATAC